MHLEQERRADLLYIPSALSGSTRNHRFKPNYVDSIKADSALYICMLTPKANAISGSSNRLPRGHIYRSAILVRLFIICPLSPKPPSV